MNAAASEQIWRNRREMTGESVGDRDLCHDTNFTGLNVGRLGVQVET